MSATLGEVVNIVGGGTPSKSEPEFWGGSIPWASVKDFKNTSLELTADFITELGVKKSATNIIPSGNIIIPTRMALGKVAINKVDMAINQDLKALIVKDEDALDKQYLLRFLESKAKYIEEQGKGATVKGITLDVLKGLEIPLPPLAEQKRIAAILDKADAIRRKRQQAIQLADDFLRAVFLDMFGDPVTNPKGWEVKKIEDIAASNKYAIKAGPFGSALKKEDYVAFGYKIYGQEQVIRDDLEYGHYFIDAKKYESLSSCAVSEGDMLISLVGSFGKIAVIPSEYAPGIINPRLMKIKFDPSFVSPWYMKYLLTTKEMLREIESMSHGGTMGIINVGKVKNLKVITPPINLQENFLRVSAIVKVVFRILCQSSILYKTEKTHDQTNIRYGSRTASPA